MNYTMVSTQQELLQCCKALAGSTFLAVDTEFLREKTYYSKLALIQVANESLTFIIDPLELDSLDTFFELINNTHITKVLHSASQDYEIFYNLQGELPKPIFDTQVAASLLGYGEQIGYANLVKNLLDVDVDKSQTRTDWTRRPLNQKQLSYAATDVIYLAQIYPIMQNRLKELNRTDWLTDDFQQLTDTNRYQVDQRAMWKKIKTANRLPAQKLSIVQELADWRETLAIKRNIPRKRAMTDDVIVDIANQQPGTIAELKEIRQINARLSDKELQQLLNCVQTGITKPESEWPRFARKHSPSTEQSAIVDILSAIVQLKAAENNISPAFICNKKDLVSLVCGSTENALYQGWRKILVGNTIKQFLAGDLRLHIDNNRAVLD
ncbi:MAG: ribonuclease D [Gammaproteobacteria bacterium]|nr:ribonuclease D [Gammaproteobacteria bacterium]